MKEFSVIMNKYPKLGHLIAMSITAFVAYLMFSILGNFSQFQDYIEGSDGFNGYMDILFFVSIFYLIDGIFKNIYKTITKKEIEGEITKLVLFTTGILFTLELQFVLTFLFFVSNEIIFLASVVLLGVTTLIADKRVVKMKNSDEGDKYE